MSFHQSRGGESMQTVSEWLTLARSGSPEAIGHVLQLCRDYLLAVANRELDSALRPKAAASDLVQETFLRAQQNFGRFHGATEEELVAWLRRILLNELGRLRQQFRETDKRDLSREAPLELEPGGLDLPRETPSPVDRAIHREEEERLASAISRLPEDYQQVIQLRHRENLNFDAIGRTMNRSADAARMLWHRAFEKLAEELDRLQT
jgi:RNA polymerase sigma-70 factor (ECF subfamily)